MKLHAERMGVGGGPRLVLVHGFTQTGRCWGPVADDLACDHEVVLVDAPGHGGSAEVEADLAVGASLIGDAGGPAVYVGYSMGGRFCLQLALDRPELVSGLVLIGASPGLADPSERAARRASDEELATRIGTLGVAAFIDEWLQLPLFAGLDGTSDCREARVANTVDGLQSSLRLAGTGAQEPLWPRLGSLSMPVLLVTGEQDVKFTAIASQMAAGIGRGATVEVIAGAGHTAHLEQPAGFLAALRAWLDRVRSAR